MMKRHIPSDNSAHQVRQSLGKVWDAIESIHNSSNASTTQTARVSGIAGSMGGATIPLAPTTLHTHYISDVDGLQDALDAKQPLMVRQTVSTTRTGMLANGVDTATLTLAKTADVIRIQTDYPAWVRVYTSMAALTADAGRAITVDPTTAHGITADVLTGAGALDLALSPVVTFANDDTITVGSAYVSIVNKDIVTRDITLTIEYLPKEV